MVFILDPKFKKKSNGEEENASLYVEYIQAYEHEEEHRYHSYLRQFSSSFSYFHMNKDINDACVDSSHQFDEFFDDNILSVDYSKNFLVPAMRLSCYEEEVVALQLVTIDIRNKLPFLTYGHFRILFVQVLIKGCI